MDRPKIGDRKPCIIGDGDTGCDGTMEWKVVRSHDNTMFDNPDRGPRQWPDPVPDYEAWVCDACGFEQKS